MNAVIFAAGKSTRTYPLTLSRPKPLLPLVNKPILAHQLDALDGLVEAVLLVVGYRKDMIEEYFGNVYEGIRLEYVVQSEQRGTGHALLMCKDRLDEPFLAMNGDDIYTAGDLAALANTGPAALVRKVENPQRFGVFEMDDEGAVSRIVEKPTAFVSNLANIGAYHLAPDVFAVLEGLEPSPRREIEITSALQLLADHHRLRTVEAQGHWLPIGYPWDLLEANAVLLEGLTGQEILGEVSPAAHLSGPVYIGEGTVVKPGAVIEGPVAVGNDCRVGPNCWLRPGATLGNECKVGQGVEIKNSILMEGAAVPHLSYIGDSVLGAHVNIGCGTVTANFRHDGANHKSVVKGEPVDTGRRKLGAIVGDGVHTGINTSLYPGRKLWPGTSTLPGQIVTKDIET